MDDGFCLFDMRANNPLAGGPLRRFVAGGLVCGLATIPVIFPPASNAVAVADLRRDATVEAVERVLPCVVNIATTTIVEYRDFYQELLRQFYGQQTPTQRREQPYNIGSGVIIDEDGYLLTNLHVLRRASRIQVKLWNGEIYDAKQCVGTLQKDVALLQIVAPPGTKFKALKLAKDDDLLLGETVLALGNPFGLGGSVARGILSAKNRRLSSGDEPLDYQDWLQTDANINPGNSGGPLINLRGELIGINVAIYGIDRGMGVSFAIPVKQVAAALSDFFTPEAANGRWFGARVNSFHPPFNVSAVQSGSPAEKAGLRVGQRLTAINGQAPDNLVEVHRLITAHKDNTAEIQVEDKGERRKVTVQLVEFEDLLQQKLGLALRALTAEEISGSRLNPGDGLVIERVEKNGPADKARLRAGFLLTALGGQKTGVPLQAAAFISATRSGERVKAGFYVPRRFGANSGSYNTTLTVR